MDLLQRINALDAAARKALNSPLLAMAPAVKDALLEMLEILRALAVEQSVLSSNQKFLYERVKNGRENEKTSG